MKREILVDISSDQTRVAMLEDGEIVELHIEDIGNERIVGNIYKGCVQNVLPGMQAAFVDIGLDKNAFLYAGDINCEKEDFVFPDTGALSPEKMQRSISDMVHQGQEIMLQVLKEPVGTKGARVTTHITLPGRTLVLVPTVDYIGVSRRIEDESERARLREIMERIKPEGMGVIVRTVAAGKAEEEFKNDMLFLTRLWERVCKKFKLVRAPRLIHAEEQLVFRTIRDMFTPEVSRLVVNDEEYYDRIKIVAGILSPEYADRVELYEGTESLFAKHNAEPRLEKLLGRKVWLKNGAYIVIDQTEALTAIDVNTGKYIGSDNLQDTLFQANCEAAKEIARQLRLRDISGIIIIDFIDMEKAEHKEAVVDLLRMCLRKDRTKTNVLGMTGLGLVEMTRKKQRNPLWATLQTPCPYCKGEGRVLSPETVAHRVRRALLREFDNTNIDTFIVRVHPSVAQVIEKKSAGSRPLLPVDRNRRLYLEADESVYVEEYEIIHVTDKAVLEKAKAMGAKRI